MFSKSIYSIKEHWWSLTLSWSDEVQRMFLIAHEFLNVKLIPQMIFMNILYKRDDFYFIMFYLMYGMFN